MGSLRLSFPWVACQCLLHLETFEVSSILQSGGAQHDAASLQDFIGMSGAGAQVQLFALAVAL